MIPAPLIPPTSPPSTLSSPMLPPSPQPPIPPPEPTSAPCQLHKSERVTHPSWKKEAVDKQKEKKEKEKAGYKMQCEIGKTQLSPAQEPE